MIQKVGCEANFKQITHESLEDREVDMRFHELVDRLIKLPESFIEDLIKENFKKPAGTSDQGFRFD